jgi:hypothetical protein
MPKALVRALTMASLIVLGACTGNAVPIDTTSGPPPLPPPAATDPQPSARTGADAYRYLLEYTALGLHRTGTEGGTRVIDWLSTELRNSGLQVTVEPFSFTQFVPRTASLRLSSDAADTASFPYWYSGRTAPGGVTAALINVGNGTDADFAGRDLRGRIVLASIALASRAVFTNLAAVQRRAAAAGAAGLVAAIQGPGNWIVASNAESDAGLCGMPTLFIGREDGQRLATHSGENANFVLDADVVQGSSANVVATITGASTDTLIAGTPVNGWFTTAAERGGGVGTLLTLARSYAERAAAGQAPAKTLVFVFTGGHEVGFIGLQRYIDAHPDVISRAYSYVHLGAAVAGRYDYEQSAGPIAQSPIADPARTLYISENPLLNSLVIRDQIAANLAPALNLLPSLSNPGEQRRMYAIGMPIVSISGTTLYFHTERDTPDTTSATFLDPAVRFYGAVIDDLIASSASDIRSANSTANQYATPVPKPVCVVPGQR